RDALERAPRLGKKRGERIVEHRAAIPIDDDRGDERCRGVSLLIHSGEGAFVPPPTNSVSLKSPPTQRGNGNEKARSGRNPRRSEMRVSRSKSISSTCVASLLKPASCGARRINLPPGRTSDSYSCNSERASASVMCSATCARRRESKRPGRLYSGARRNSSGVNAVKPRARAALTQYSFVSTPTPCPERCSRVRPIPQPRSSVNPGWSRRRFHRNGAWTSSQRFHQLV